MGVFGDFLDILNFIFVDLWEFFTSWYIPGTTVTPAAWAISGLVLVKVVQIVRTIFDIKNGDDP